MFFQIYVLPSIDKIPESHPHAERINKLVAEEKKKLEDVTEFLGPATQPTVAIHKDPAQSRETDLGARNEPPEPCISSVSGKTELGNPEERQEVPSVGGASPQIDSIIRMQTFTQCQELFCGDAESDGTKILCNPCTENLSAPQSSSIEEPLTLYRCGVCFADFFERDVLARHMDEQHAVPGVVTRTSADTTRGPTVFTDVAMLCPPANLLLRNIVLQALPLTFADQNVLLNAAPMFALQPSVLTPLSQSPATVTPKNFLSAPSTSLPVPTQGPTDTGEVFIPDPVSQGTKPKLDSMNEAMDNNKTPPDGNPVEKTKISKSNIQSEK